MAYETDDCYAPVKLPHSANNIGEITPQGAPDSTGKMMGPTGGVDSGTSLTPMKAGIGEIPVDSKSSSVPSAPIDGLHDVGKVDGKNFNGPGSGGSMMSHRDNASGMTYDYPGL